MLELLECIPLISRQLLESIRQVGLGPAPLSTLKQLAGGRSKAKAAALSMLPPQPVHWVITQFTSERFITFSLKTSPWASCCAALQLFNKTTGCREEKKMWIYK